MYTTRSFVKFHFSKSLELVLCEAPQYHQEILCKTASVKPSKDGVVTSERVPPLIPSTNIGLYEEKIQTFS